MTRDISPLGVRIPTEIKERIEKSAEENLRSINSEIVARLMASFQQKSALSDFSDGDLIKELVDRYERGAIEVRIGKTRQE